MEWIPDKLFRFKERPRFTDSEMELACELVISTVLIQRYGHDSHRAVTEDDLSVALEQHLGAQVELYADFSSQHGWVQGSIDFGQTPPLVQIRKQLSENATYIHRLK